MCSLFLKRNVGVTERPRSLNPSKAIIVHVSTQHARSTHSMVSEFVCAVRIRRNN